MTVRRTGSYRIDGCFSVHTKMIQLSHMTDELTEELQKARPSRLLSAFRGRSVYANACQKTAGTPRHCHINIHVQILNG